MKNIFNKQFNKFLPLYLIMVSLVILASTSYALLWSSARGTHTYTMTVGNLEINFVDQDTDEIQINNMYPMSDSEGLAQTGSGNILEFTISNDGNLKANYNVYIEELSTNPAMSSVIKYSYSIKEPGESNFSEYSEPILLSTDNYIVRKGVLDVSETADFKVKIWLDESANNTYMNQSFRARVVVEALQYEKNGAEKILAIANSIQNCTRTVTDTDGIIYISGKSDNPSIYANATTDSCVIDFNYVWWSGKMWRVTAIYPDGAMKLITDNNITTLSFNDSDQVYYYTKADPGNSITESKSYVFQWLNEDFLSALYNQGADIIDYTKYWNETMPSATAISTKPAEDSTTMIPTTTSPVGLLNSYEYYMAYTNATTSNNYLRNGYYYWLLNPYYNETTPSRVWGVSYGGNGNNFVPTSVNGVRPSIIIKSGIMMSGNGTKTSPYRIAADYADATANDSLYTRHSGEYIKFSSDGNNGDYTNAPLYRIVEVVGSGSTRTTKIVSMNFASYDNSGTPTYTKKFGASTNATGVTWGTCTSNDCWSYYLNDLSGEWYQSLSFKNKLTSGTYYLGRVPDANRNYKLAVCSDSNFDASNTISDCITNGTVAATWVGSNGDSGNVGILRYGEMFATRQQPGNMGTINYMWLISSYTTSYVWVVSGGDSGSGNFPTNTNALRPSYFLKSSVNVLSGSGLETDPFIVD